MNLQPKTKQAMSQLRIAATREELRKTAHAHDLRLTFRREGRLWSAVDFKGREIWTGSLAEVRRVAAGKLPQ